MPSSSRAVLEIPCDVHAALKAIAAHRGMKLYALTLQIIRAWLDQQEAPEAPGTEGQDVTVRAGRARKHLSTA